MNSAHFKATSALNALTAVRQRYRETSEYSIEPHTSTKMHKLLEAERGGLLLQLAGAVSAPLPQGLQPFLIQHDWASFIGTEVLPSEVRLPFPVTAFELKLNGMIAVLIASQGDDGHIASRSFFEAADGVWFAGATELEDTFAAILWRYASAVCVVLDAEIAEYEVVRASVVKNQIRSQRSRPPIPDSRVVNLAKRRRVSDCAPEGATNHRGVKLHFRRGHWYRPSATKVVWRRWTLVGDPDLGFVDKHYRI